MNYYYHDYSREQPYAHYNRRHSVNGSSWNPSVTNSISSGMIYPNDPYEPEKKKSWCLLISSVLLFLAAGGALGIGIYIATIQEEDEPKLYYVGAIVGGCLGLIGSGLALKGGLDLSSRNIMIGSTVINLLACLGGVGCLCAAAYAIIQYKDDCCPNSRTYNWDEVFEALDASDVCEEKCVKEYLLFFGVTLIMGTVVAITALMVFFGSCCSLCCGSGDSEAEGDPGDPGPTMINAPRGNGYY